MSIIMNFKWFLESNIEKKVIKKLPIHEKQKQILQRRVNKLKRDPKGFIEDSYVKRKNQVRKYLPIKYNGHFQYTVVSAVYNVEKYLDDYFKSLVNQSLNFKKHIQLILVDDGSTDNSAQIIKKWQKKCPNNIEYYYKENGGQASARNLGLQYVQTEWVTFIDPDDFVDVDYFKNVDDILIADPSVKMLIANTYFYIESNGSFKDTHPLRFRFHKKDKRYPVSALGNNINLSASATIFSYDIIQKNVLAFDQRVKPNFEDGKFIGEFLLNSEGAFVWFADNVIYNYRKRDDGTSTLDDSWSKSEKFSKVLEYGFLDLLQNYKKHLGYVPENIQTTAMYDMYWYLVHLLNQPEKIDFLTNEERTNYHNLYCQVMEYIDAETIIKFGIAGAWFFHKVGFLGAFKGKKPSFQICYIESVDHDKRQVLISHFDYFDLPVSYKVNGVDTQPKYQKTVRNEFNGKLFTYEKRAWIAVEDLQSELVIEIDGKIARLALKKHKHIFKYKVQDIFNAFRSAKYISDGSWLLMDRETKADDNAEHLYRYLMQKYPEQKCYFALNRDAADWERLSAEGFDLVAFGEHDFEQRLSKCEKIISSHIEAHIHNYFSDFYDGTKKFVFLQHGVTKDDLSRWLNGKKHVACFITTTQDEYNSIVYNQRYKFTKKEVKLTGFPRHDVLYQKNNQNLSEKIILIMPTWRNYLIGETIGKGANIRELNPNFLKSTYASHWLSLLKSDKLKELVEQFSYQIIFAPHANIQSYLDLMNLPSYLNIWYASQATESIQDLFVKADFMITDYSSTTFEMAYIGKPTLYYQFDKQEFFSGKHSYQKGYFEYEKHGFGPVVYDESSLLVEVKKVLTFGVDNVYEERIHNTFEYQDDRNCERVYQAIVALDEPDDGSVNAEILAQAVASARKHKVWHLIESRLLKQIELNLINELDLFNIQQEICQAMYMQGKYKGLLDYLPTTKLNTMQQKYWQVKLDFWLGNYQILQDYFIQNKATSIEDGILNLLACAYLHDQKGFDEQKQWLLEQILSSVELSMLNIAELVLQGQDFEVCTFVDSMLTDDELIWQLDEMRLYKPLLIGAKSAIVLREFDLCLKYIRTYEKKVSGDYASRLILAQQDFAKDSHKWATVHYEKLIEWGVDLPKVDYIHYIESLYHTKQDMKIESYSLDFELILANDNLLDMWMNYQSAKKNWQTILNVLDKFNDEQKQKFIYFIVLSYYRTGQVEEAYKICRQPELADSYEYWELIAELAVLIGDKELAKYCYRTMVAVFPNKDKEQNIQRLSNLNHE